MQVGSDWYLYHEKQDAALCGVHCLNSLLQGDYFTEIDLMQFARELDEAERRVMMEMGTETTDFLHFMAEDSGNVADDGNYSIQVLSKALAIWHLQAIPITNPEMAQVREDPLKQRAFICNLASHWLTIRKCGENWYNLNSLLDEPQFLSNFYLSAFLDTLMASGYTIFCIQGTLPPVPLNTDLLVSGRWKLVTKKRPAKGKDDDLEKALAESELEEAIRLSMQASQAVDPVEEDQELEMALKLSQQNRPPDPEPEPGPYVTSLLFRLPTGQRLERRFLKTDLLQNVFNYLSSNGIDMSKHDLISNSPRSIYCNVSTTLEELKLFPRVALVIERIKK